ncbi:signal peptidase I SipW [Alkalihalobacillus trypoxylicola]|uniref:Signal peptidase I n=1 Tax=Alkalihalobacillus trypoxylicola TaxID=519424 RepID=A0A162D0R0_9BACI|nr:signal peptidase I [Alkalihalobacillus trypoxylicola]KYG27626.1 S26 family signal peptidase [Alkalihalobacillus trypoxylicola]
MWKILRKIINHFCTGLMLLFLMSMFILVISSRATEGEPNILGYQIKTVLSGSMEPEMLTGSLILIQKAEQKDRFTVGDVVTYRTAENVLITHRIIEVINNGQSYITKGDHNNGPDIEPVLSDNIVGKYTGITVPYVGYVTQFIQSKQGALILFIIPGVLLLIHSIFTIWRVLRIIEKNGSIDSKISIENRG